jgi:hypothetical protein
VERNLKYWELEKEPEMIRADLQVFNATKARQNNINDINEYKTTIRATKEWKPERRIVVSFTANDHTTSNTIKEIEKDKDKYPTLAPKLIQVINFRKNAMLEMNKTRGNPMRNIYINIVLTPMDFKADCSWTIHRSEEKGNWDYTTHFLHTTEYNLAGAEAVEYKSREQMMTQEEKKQEEENKKRLAELKKTAYPNYFLMSCYDLGRALNKCSFAGYNIDDIINDEEWFESTRWNAETKACDEKYQTHSIHQVVATNVNHTDNTFTIIGYMTAQRISTTGSDEIIEPYIKKAKVEKTITYPAPGKRVKITQLQKDLKKLTQNYVIPK